MRNFVVIFVLLLLGINLKAQNNFSYTFAMGEGYVLPTNTFLKGENVDNTKVTNMTNVSFRFAKHIHDVPPHHLYNDFRYGIGAFYGAFNYSKNLGNPFALYAFAGFSPIKYGRFTYKNELALGFSGPWQIYSETNRENVVVSMPIESYFHLDFEGCWTLSQDWQLNTGLAFIHFSNGAFKKPNKGANVLSAQLGLTYTPKAEKIKFRDLPIEDSKPWNIYANVWGGVHAVNFDYGENQTVQKSYAVYGLQFRYMRNLSTKYALGLGAECLENTSVGKTDSIYYLYPERRDYKFVDRFHAGAYLAFQYNIYDFSILLEPGYAFLQVHGYASRMYQRLGLRYNISKHSFAQMALRAYSFHVADFIEFGLGVKF